MPVERFANFARSVLAVGLPAAAPGDVGTLTLIGGGGARFPVADFYVTVDLEVLLCTARVDDDLAVVRGRQGTAATAHQATSYVLHGVLAEALEGFEFATADHWLRWAT